MEVKLLIVVDRMIYIMYIMTCSSIMFMSIILFICENHTVQGIDIWCEDEKQSSSFTEMCIAVSKMWHIPSGALSRKSKFSILAVQTGHGSDRYEEGHQPDSHPELYLTLKRSEEDRCHPMPVSKKRKDCLAVENRNCPKKELCSNHLCSWQQSAQGLEQSDLVTVWDAPSRMFALSFMKGLSRNCSTFSFFSKQPRLRMCVCPEIQTNRPSNQGHLALHLLKLDRRSKLPKDPRALCWNQIDKDRQSHLGPNVLPN